ncbi:hypothetical protein ACFPZ0_24600 [Streptomonospora nanhaiensis]|uniref:hypothetical protein n=1 Tax=Streptomonospora nanhaiensis TaxID=1323731 RepID=UPI001C387B17|nr:hypothetical protein [Streptomonospora nanhaiensis]MBV2364987.1 hypothetical protein [Streptomonospora nanhaiensis]MBX9391307.1 hypothetical protein [Streptomonospora nanhaiensis]
MLDAVLTVYGRLRHLLRYRRNPALYIAAALVVVLTGWRLANGMPAQEVFTEHYLESMLILAAGVLTRFQVWSPESVEDLFAAREAYPAPEDTVEFDPHLAAEPGDGTREG